MSSVVVVPLQGGVDASFSQITALDGTDFTFIVEWNGRAGAWFLSLFDVDENPIIQSKKMVIDHDLLNGVVSANRPVGKLLLIELSGSYREATFESLGTQHQLHYVVQ